MDQRVSCKGEKTERAGTRKTETQRPFPSAFPIGMSMQSCVRATFSIRLPSLARTSGASEDRIIQKGRKKEEENKQKLFFFSFRDCEGKRTELL